MNSENTTTHPRLVGSRLLLGLASSILLASAAVAVPPTFSVASLQVDSSWSRDDLNSRPHLAWTIAHPSTTKDLCTVVPESGLVWPLTRLRVRMYVLGAGSGTTPGPHLVSFSRNFSDGEGWKLSFQGGPEAVSASEPVVDQIIPVNKPVKVGATGVTRYGDSYSWFEFRTNEKSNGLVKVFKDGDAVPFCILQGPEPFLRTYISAPVEGGGPQTFVLGPQDLLFLFELNASSAEDVRFDHQDCAVLVNFERA